MTRIDLAGIKERDVDLPECCPGALVRKITERDHVVWNRVEVSPGAIATRVWYECASCGKRLAPFTAPPAGDGRG